MCRHELSPGAPVKLGFRATAVKNACACWGRREQFLFVTPGRNVAIFSIPKQRPIKTSQNPVAAEP